MELIEHLAEAVIPLEKQKKIPAKPPVNLPRQKDHASLGNALTLMDLIALDNNQEIDKESLRLWAMKERDRLESNGFGDQLMEMQKAMAPIDHIFKGSWRIDMCFEYTEKSEAILQKCQGEVTKLVK